MKRLNKAFTLTELLVALGVIGILCAILLPVIFNMLPNQNTIMAKRAYYMVQTVVADLINDEGCYPDKTSATGTNHKYGFDDGYGTANCLLWGGEEKTNTIDTPGNADEKFGKLFVDKIDTLKSSVSSTGTSFTTGDGMTWIMSKGFNGGGKNSTITVVVDVNGASKPNCGNSAATKTTIDGTAYDACTGRTTGWDRFAMTIRTDGKINVLDDWAAKAVRVDKDITEE